MIEGVVRPRVGYAGGQSANPNYSNIGDHTETVQVDYDPQRITYTQLLDVFWQNHEPAGRFGSRQYMHAIFYHDDHQRKLAMASKLALEEKIGRHVNAEVAPLRSFTMAEDYHQKYILKRYGRLSREISTIYPLHQDLVASTAAARLNGYAGGYGNQALLAREIDTLGLSAAGKQALTEMVTRKSSDE